MIDEKDSWSRYVLGCAWWIGQRTDLMRGISIAVDSDVPVGGGVASSAAIEVATMTALASLVGLEITALELAEACQFVENNIAGAPCGLMDQIVCTLGRKDQLLPILCQKSSGGESVEIQCALEIPTEARLEGIYCGIAHDISGDPYTETRVAAFMGRRMLEEMGCDVGGYLARVNSTVYEKEFAEELPAEMTGREFLERFGETADGVTSVSREAVYRVRGATDHHVFEADRVKRFVSALRSGASGNEKSLREAGEMMRLSHESYGNCAKLGHPATDKLVDLLLKKSDVVYGAKITGGGCGGTVAVMLKNTRDADDVVDAVLADYALQAGLESMRFSGSSDGAWTYGAHVVVT
jgi:L-arabinokinase